MTVLAATGDYQRADYRLVRGPRGEGLVFELEDKPRGPDYFKWGLISVPITVVAVPLTSSWCTTATGWIRMAANGAISCAWARRPPWQ